MPRRLFTVPLGLPPRHEKIHIRERKPEVVEGTGRGLLLLPKCIFRAYVRHFAVKKELREPEKKPFSLYCL